MLSIDLTGKRAFLTGVADDGGFAWHIAKSLQAAGAEVYLACHPRVVGIVQRFVERDKYAESRQLPYGVEGELKPAAIFGCDVEFDTAADIPEDKQNVKGYRDEDVSIAGALAKYSELTNGAGIDFLIHSVAFSPEIQNSHLMTSRSAYLTAMSISSYSLIAMTRAAQPMMKDRDASVVGLTYLASQRTTPGYGGGMATAKAALECDARTIAHFVGGDGIRVNLLSPGPYASRAARSIGDVNEMIEKTAEHSPLRRAITGEDVADATVFLCSPLSRSITGEVIYIDSGFHTMSALA
ncbi:MAG: SDR family oxidoreductase [Deltaproteobacteria bacterium]